VVLKFLYAENACFYYVQDGPVLPRDGLVAKRFFVPFLQAIEDRRKIEQHTVSHLRIEPRWLQLPTCIRIRTISPLADTFLEGEDTRCIDPEAFGGRILVQMKPRPVQHPRRTEHGVTIHRGHLGAGPRGLQSIYEETAVRKE